MPEGTLMLERGLGIVTGIDRAVAFQCAEPYMRILGTTELAVVLRDDRPVLVLEDGKTESSDRNTLWQKLRPMMEQLPRGQQLTDILITEDPLPRTASGKIKRWELQQKVGTRT